MTTAERRGNPLALSGVLFATFFIISLVLLGVLASAPLPLPGAPTAEVVRFYEGSRAAALSSGFFQVLSAVSLFVFAPCVAAFVRSNAGQRGALPGLTLTGGVLAAAFLLLSALLSLVLVPVAAGGNLTLVGVLRDLNFLTGGAAHVASLGLFVGAGSAARATNLPRWISWLGIVAAALSLLSLTSLIWFPASILLPIGRLLCFVWSVAVGVVLARGGRSTAPTR